MSTNPDPAGATANRVVSLLSHWLARHTTTSKLREELERLGTAELSPAQAEAVDEVLAELRDPDVHPGDLEMIVRETLEAVALG